MAKRLDRFTQPFVQSRIPFLLTEVLTDGHGKMTDLVCRFANSAAGTLLSLPPEQGFLKVSDRNLQVSAFKKAEDRDSLILRVYNPTGQPVRAKVEITVPGAEVRQAIVCDMNEERTAEAQTVENGCFEASVAVNEIRTFELVF